MSQRFARTFVTPHHIVYGPDALTEASSLISSLGSRALIVTDSMMGKLGNLTRLTNMLEGADISYYVYDQVNSEPIDTMVATGYDHYRDKNCNFIIALGGGSPIDAMKAIAMVAATSREIDSFMGESYTGPVCPMVAIPTTAGTGSEATRFTIITDTARNVKMLLSGNSLIPEVAIVDPAFTLTAPASVTSSTGLDALCHCIEAYTSRKAQPLSDTFALSAAKRIFANLATCVREPNNVEARTQMSLAATEAGIAFNNSSVTIIHGMSRPIGALFHVPHGLSNAMLMEACLGFALDGAYDRFAQIARHCGLSSSADDKTSAQSLMAAIHDLLAELKVPTLKDYGIDRREFHAVIEKMASDAEKSGSPANTIKPVSIEDMQALYRKVYA